MKFKKMPTGNKVKNIKSNLKKKLTRALGHGNEQVQTGIIPAKPGWISRWIFPHFFAVLLLLFAVLWFIHHPQFIKTNGVLTGVGANGKILSVSMDIPENNAEKIISGQLVQIQYKEHSNSAFEQITGKLLSVSVARDEKKLTADVSLPRELTTIQHKNFDHEKGKQVSVVIIVKDQRLLERFLSNPIKKQ